MKKINYRSGEIFANLTSDKRLIKKIYKWLIST